MKEEIIIEASRMYPDTEWRSFWVPTKQNLFYREKMDADIEADEIRRLINQAGIDKESYRLAKQYDGFTIHVINEATAFKVAAIIDYDERCKQHEEANRWMYGD